MWFIVSNRKLVVNTVSDLTESNKTIFGIELLCIITNAMIYFYPADITDIIMYFQIIDLLDNKICNWMFRSVLHKNWDVESSQRI